MNKWPLLFAKDGEAREMRKVDHLTRRKFARISAGGRLRVLDLFFGCSDLFHGASFQPAAAIDPDAPASHAHNFHGGDAA
jgi:hypothetical protein